MKKTSILVLFSITALVIITWFSCNKKEQAVSPPLPGNETLTTMVLLATNPNDPTDTPSAQWKQLDPMGAAPVDYSNDTLKLKKNVSYNVRVKFLDSLTDLTPEIKDRENYHLLCFNDTGGLSLSVTSTDQDTNPQKYPVGLADIFATPNLTNSGVLEVTLHHQPNVKNGTCAPGSIDMDCTFFIKIQ